MLEWWIFTQCFHVHVRFLLIDMETIYPYIVLYVSNILLAISSYLMFCALWIWYLSFLGSNPARMMTMNSYFWKMCNTHNHTFPCTIKISYSVVVSGC